MKQLVGLVITLLVLNVPAWAYEAATFPGKGNRADFDKALNLGNQGYKLGLQGKRRDEIAMYERAIAIYPYNAATHFNLGNAFSALGENAKAIAAYKKAVVLAPDYADAYTSMVDDYAALNDWRSAEQAARTACKLAPKDAGAHMNLGEVLLQTKRLPEAAKVIDAALKMPNVAEFREELQKMKVRARG